jgi:urease gamma subunit
MSADSKDPDEIITVTFPFADELGGATLSSVDYVTMAVVNGEDASASAMLNGSAVISGGDVLQSVQNGLHLVDYKTRCRAILSDGRKLVRALDLPVRTR